MGVFRKFKALFHDDWCQDCTVIMNLQKKQLFQLPMTVGHYVQHDNPNYYIENAYPVSKKADIPTGFYACGAYLYQCPQCQKKVVKLTIFLPVRDQEQVEESFLYTDPNLIKLLEKC